MKAQARQSGALQNSRNYRRHIENQASENSLQQAKIRVQFPTILPGQLSANAEHSKQINDIRMDGKVNLTVNPPPKKKNQ